MKKNTLFAFVALALALPGGTAKAQSSFPTASSRITVPATVPLQCDASAANCVPASTANPVPVAIGTLPALPAGANTIGTVRLPTVQASTTAGQTGALVMGGVTTTAPAYTTAQANPLSLTIGGALRGDIASYNGNALTGTVTAYGTAPTGNVFGVNAAVTSGTITTVSAVSAANLGIPGIVTDIASAALTTTTAGATITPPFGLSYEVNIPVTAVTGTAPTLDVIIQESDDNGGNWFDIYHFPRITAIGMYRSPKLPLTGNRVRYLQNVTGTTPSFTRAVNRLQSSDTAAPLRGIFDRTLATTQALSSTTATVNVVAPTRNLQLVISAGTITTTAPALQLQGSEDNGASWYAIGTPLVAVSGATVQLTVSDFNAERVRAIVTTAGVAATLNYVAIKAW